MLLHGAVAFQVPNIVAVSGHLHAVERAVAAHPGDEAARGVGAAAVRDGERDFPDVFAGVEVEGRGAPVGFGLLRFLLQREEELVPVNLGDAASAELLFIRLPVAHRAGGLLLARVAEEGSEGEVEDVVPREDQQVVVELLPLDGVLHVPDGAEAGFVGLGPVVHDGDGEAVVLGPGGKVRGEAVVRDDEVFVDGVRGREVVEEPVQDRFAPDVQEGLREVLGQGIEPGGVARGEDEALHTLPLIPAPSALWQKWTENLPSSRGKSFR